VGQAELRRVSVYAGTVGVDLAVPASLPVGLLIPAIVDMLPADSRPRSEPVAVSYQLSLPGQVALEQSKTLQQHGIRDGVMLTLTESSEKPPPRCFDDAAEVVSASLTTVTWPWTRHATRVAGAVTACWLAGGAALMLTRAAFCTDNTSRTGLSAGVAAAAGCAALLAAVMVRRGFGDTIASLTLGVLAIGLAADAGLLVVPGGPGAPNVLLAAMAAAVASVVMKRITCCGTTVFIATACFAVIVAAVALVDAVMAASLRSVGVVCAAASLGLIQVSARASVLLAGLSPQLALEAVAERTASTPGEMCGKAIHANSWHTGLVVAFSASSALGAACTAIGVYASGRQPSVAFAFIALTGGVLLLRACSHNDGAAVAALVICGTVVLSTALGLAAAMWPQHISWIATTAATLGAVALYPDFSSPTMTLSFLGRRGIELVELLALAGIVPLACWICGLYAAARDLTLS
jgi:type VII secretion integral membrane protein EccD